MIKKYSKPLARKNHTNKKFGLLTAKYMIGPNERKSIDWFCQCECGNTKIVASDILRTLKSCGCIKKRTMMNHNSWKGYGEIPLTRFNAVKSNANRKNREFTISIEYIWDLFLRQERKCAITGIELTFSGTNKKHNNITASLDRIDSSKGYIEGNIQWIHKELQGIKGDLLDEKLIYWAKLISNGPKAKKFLRKSHLGEKE